MGRLHFDRGRGKIGKRHDHLVDVEAVVPLRNWVVRRHGTGSSGGIVAGGDGGVAGLSRARIAAPRGHVTGAAYVLRSPGRVCWTRATGNWTMRVWVDDFARKLGWAFANSTMMHSSDGPFRAWMAPCKDLDF